MGTPGNRNGQVLSSLFVTFLALPLLVSLLRPAEAVSQSEKRRLAPFPAAPATLAAAKAYPAGFDAWFSDHFGLRTPLGQLHALARVKLLRTSPRPGVLVGRNGWLYYGGDPMRAYLGALDMPPKAFADFQLFLEAKRDWLAERGIRYLFVLAPDKPSVYPEYVPHRPSGPSAADRLMAHLAAHSDIDALDLRAPLLAAKSPSEPLYMKTDSHWNALGAYVGYRAIADRVARWMPLEPIPREHAGLVRRAGKGGNLADQVNIAPFTEDEKVVISPDFKTACGGHTPAPVQSPVPWPAGQRPFSTHCEGAAQARVLVLRDSFANDLIPFLSRQFSDVTYVWQGTDVHPLWESFSFIGQAVSRQPVDLVIEHLPERKLLWTIGIDPEFLMATARRRFAAASPATRPMSARPVQHVQGGQTPQGLLLRPTGPNPVVEAPLGPVQPGRWPVVRLSLTSPAPTRLAVLFQTAEDRKYSPKRRLTVPVPAGRFDAYFEIPSGQAAGSLLIGLGSGAGDFVLHGVEVRTGRADINVATPARRLSGPGGAGA